jgi:phosphoribosylanthranilate isomerase
VKICGLTRPDEALRCAAWGADAIGLVFFPKSPRNVSIDQARGIVAELPDRVAAVGVFVNADFDTIMARVDGCGISMAQLHGRETPELVDRLRAAGVGVIKGLFIDGEPGIEAADRYAADAFLVECSKGPLPGGNAMAWDWAAAREFGRRYPLVLAGGLAPANVAAAITDARPAAVDVSSGVEAAPGRKDTDTVRRFIDAVRRSAGVETGACPRVFRPRRDGARG